MRAKIPDTVPNMAPVESSDARRDAEIALARSSGSECDLSRTLRSLYSSESMAYETAVEAKEWRSRCAVERGAGGTGLIIGFWNANESEPICYNPPAVRSVIAVHNQEDGTFIGWKSTIAQMPNETKPPMQEGPATILEPGRDVLTMHVRKSRGTLRDAGH